MNMLSRTETVPASTHTITYVMHEHYRSTDPCRITDLTSHTQEYLTDQAHGHTNNFKKISHKHTHVH